MEIINFFRKFYQRDTLLATAGWVHIGLLLVFLILMPLDDRLVMNVDPWIKPAKFAASIAIFS
jgi:hypothetical protein